MEATEVKEVETEAKEEVKEKKHGHFRVKRDATFPHVTAGGVENPDQVEHVTYPAGSVLDSSHLPKWHQEQLAAGRYEDFLDPVSDEEAEAAGGDIAASGGEPEYGVFVAEHEAEAHALEQYGHAVVPDDQALELGSASEEYSAQYQQAVKDAGMDRRPHQEATNPANRQRIPDEILYGTQTRSGAPHYRGPAETQEAEEEGEHEAEEAGAATRPRPDVSEAGSEETAEESEV